MTRRGGGQGLGYAGPSQAAGPQRAFLLGGAVLAVVVLGAYLAFRACGGSECTKLYCSTSANLPIPEGYERVTQIFRARSDATIPDGNDVSVFLPLDQPTTDGRNLSFYRYIEETGAWEPITPAILDPQGTTVAATLSTTPRTIAVLRRLSSTGHVVGYVGQNQVLNPEGAPHLTILHTRDFRPGSDGQLEGELTDPQFIGASPQTEHFPMVYANAAERGLIPILDSLLTNAQTRSTHVRAITTLAVERQVPGIDIAYFDLPPTLRTPFALFIVELAQSLHGQNKRLSVTLPSPLKAGDRVDEGSYDWKLIGGAADIVQIAPYRDQSTLRRDFPEVLTYLSSIVDPLKLVMTVSPYATEKSVDGTRAMTLVEAMGIAATLQLRTGPDGRVASGSVIEVVAPNINQSESRSGIGWQAATACVTFTYEQSGPRTVWIENFFSIGFKLQFVTAFKLGGVAIEDAGGLAEVGNSWPALLPFISSGQPILMQPNPADLTPRWFVSNGTADGGQKGLIKWSTPTEAGTHTVRLTVSDGVAFFENTIPVTVQPAPRPSATPAAGATPTRAN